MKKQIKLLAAILLLTSVTSCSLFNTSSSTSTQTSSETGSSDTGSSDVSSSDTVSSDVSSSDTVSSDVTSSDSDSSSDEDSSSTTPTSNNPSFKEYNEALEWPTMPTTGDVNMMVVPVAFKGDTTCSGARTGTSSCADAKADLETTFFNDTAVGGHESVRSFYGKSSYGKLNLDGTVDDVFTLDLTLLELLDKIGTDDELESSQYTSDELMDQAFDTYVFSKYFNERFGSGKKYQISDYDADNNGKVDGIWFVYFAPNIQNFPEFEDSRSDYYDYYYAAQTVLWAFTYTSYTATIPMGIYGWASYDFSKEQTYTGIGDTHTYIHETGHMLGLDDYYDYDYYPTSPSGGLDMMDYNVLDHNAYSKWLLGWAEPIHITKADTYNLKPLQDEGTFYLISDDWNGSYYDQFIILEYYTPTGLNLTDSQNRYGNYPLGFTQNGVKAYLVDARVGRINVTSDRYGYTATWDGRFYDEFEVSTSDNYYYSLIYSNTRTYSMDPTVNSSNYQYDNNYGYIDVPTGTVHPLLRLLEATGSNDFVSATYYRTHENLATATNNSLFQNGDSLPSNYSLYGGAQLPFTFTVGECTSTGASITFTAK